MGTGQQNSNQSNHSRCLLHMFRNIIISTDYGSIISNNEEIIDLSTSNRVSNMIVLFSMWVSCHVIST